MNNKQLRKHVTETFIEMVDEIGLSNVYMRNLCEISEIPIGSFKRIMGCSFTLFKKKTCAQYKLTEDDKLKPILNVSIRLAEIYGYNHISVKDVAEACNLARETIYNYFGTVQNLRCKVLLYAMEKDNMQIIIQAIANNDLIVRSITEQQRVKAAQYIIKDVR